jgi:hypothetical protein
MLQDWIKDYCKPKAISLLIDIIRKFLEYGNHNLKYMRTLFKNSTTLKREGFFLDIIIINLREAHHAQEEESIGSIHPHEDNTLIIAPLVEDGKQEQS